MVMERFFTTELLRMIGILGFGGLSLMVLLGRLIAKLRGSFQPYRKTTIIFLLVAAGIFGVIGFTGHRFVFSSASYFYMGYQAVFCLLGIAHLFAMYKYMAWSNTEKSFWLELLFTIIVAAFGVIAFALIFKWMNKDGYYFAMSTAVLFFLVPFFVLKTFKAALDIQPKIFKQWYYPVNSVLPEPEESKLKNILLINFQFQKTTFDPDYTSFRAKAPADMEFGQLFYYFMNDYNDRHPNSRLEYMDKKREPYGWIFYRKPKWYHITTKYIDPDRTFFINRIKEDDIIICRRTITL
jgi:hypothetical protein